MDVQSDIQTLHQRQDQERTRIQGTRVAHASNRITERRLNWYGHVPRRDKEHILREVLRMERMTKNNVDRRVPDEKMPVFRPGRVSSQITKTYNGRKIERNEGDPRTRKRDILVLRGTGTDEDAPGGVQ